MFNAYDLFKIYKAAKSNMADVTEDVLLSVQGMFIGFVVSLTYLASLVVIYNGKNAEDTSRTATSDLGSTVLNILLIVGIETATSVVTIVIMRFKCNISPDLVFFHLMKEYGFIISALADALLVLFVLLPFRK